MSSYGDIWADTYDSVHTLTEDIAFWVEEAQGSGGPVLELGCGTGRVALPIAQAGVSLVGLDSSSAMLRVARAKARKLRLGSDLPRFVKGDMRDFSLDGQQFPLIIVPFRSFQLLLSVADQYQALAAIREHLEPAGRVVIDLFVPDLGQTEGDSSMPVPSRERIDSATGHRVLIGDQNTYDPFNQILNVRNIVEELDEGGGLVRKVYKNYQLRYIYRFEMQHLLAASGYDVVDVYGAFDREPLDESSTEMIWVATPL